MSDEIKHSLYQKSFFPCAMFETVTNTVKASIKFPPPLNAVPSVDASLHDLHSPLKPIYSATPRANAFFDWATINNAAPCCAYLPSCSFWPCLERSSEKERKKPSIVFGIWYLVTNQPINNNN